MNLKDLLPVAMAIVVIGIGISIGAEVTGTIGASDASDYTANVVGEVWNPANGTVFNLSQANLVAGTFTAVNTSSRELVHADNYTLDTTTGEIQLVAGSTYNTSSLDMNFTWDNQLGNQTSAGDVVNNATAGLAEMGEWFPTIGLVVAASIVLGLLMTAFYFGRRN